MSNLIKRIGISGIGPFHKQVLKVPTGIVYLYGKNLKRDGGNGNAAGKSLLGSSVAEIFYDTPIVGTRQDKSKKGIRFVEFQRGKRLVKIQSSFQGKSQKLTVTVDGEDKSGRINKNTKEFIKKVWPINENEYRTYGHLDSRKTHHLVSGNSAERKVFFTEFFGLDKLDAEKKVIASAIHNIKKVTLVREELKRTFDDVKKDLLPAKEFLLKESLIDELTKKVENLRKNNDFVTEVRRLLEFERFAGAKLKKFYSIVPNLEDYDEIFSKVRKRLRRAEKNLEIKEDWDRYCREIKRYRDRMRLVPDGVTIQDLEKSSNAYVRSRSLIEELDGERAPDKVKKPVQPGHDRKLCISDQIRIQHQLDHAKKFKDGKCYECGQSVSKVEDPKKLKEKLERVSLQLEEWETYDQDLKDYEKYRNRVESFAAAQEKLKVNKKLLKTNEDGHKLFVSLKGLVKPDKVDKPEFIESVEPIRQEYELLQFFEQHLPTLKALSNLTKEARLLKTDHEELAKLQDRLSKLTAEVEVHRSVKDRAKKLKSRLSELEIEIRDREALELLMEGYSDKAVKKMVIEAINTHLMESVNQYSSIAFDDYRFEFLWGTQIQILVHRPGMETTDVRKLSGAESTLFTLVLTIALMKFVPVSKRLSMIILDEPTASFSEETTELFHRLLPHLNRIIPTVMVITPDARERFEGATELTVLRDNQGARIVEGHPNEV